MCRIDTDHEGLPAWQAASILLVIAALCAALLLTL